MSPHFRNNHYCPNAHAHKGTTNHEKIATPTPALSLAAQALAQQASEGGE